MSTEILIDEAEEQRIRVSQRLQNLRTGAVTSIVRIKDAKRLLNHAISTNVLDADKLPSAQLAYEVLSRVPRQGLNLNDVGLIAIAGNGSELHPPDPVMVLRQIEGEFYQRSLAHYEHNFKTPVQ